MNKPELVVRGIIINDGKILLCKNLKHGYNFLPGGHIEEGESAEYAFKREMQEEVGKVVLSVKKITEFENSYQEEGEEKKEIIYLYSAELEDYKDIKSLEAHIGFDWIEIIDLRKVDLRPQRIIQDILKNI